MKKLYSSFNDVLLIDSTYRSNKYKLPLLILAGINEEGRTFIFGFGVVQSEEYLNVKWVLNKLFSFLGANPKIICSDSCPTLGKVIAELLPQATHLLCGWHVAQNFKSHVKSLSIYFTTCIILTDIIRKSFYKRICRTSENSSFLYI